MKPRSPARKALALVAAVALVGFVLWFRNQPPVMSGTKATFSLVGTKAAPAGGPGGTTRATTATSNSVSTATTATTVEGR